MHDLYRLFLDVEQEVKRSTQKHGHFNSSIEGLAVLEEEVDEFKHDVRHGTKSDATKEAIQVAAMAFKWLEQYGEFPNDYSRGQG